MTFSSIRIFTVCILPFLFGYCITVQNPIYPHVILDYQLCGNSYELECAAVKSSMYLYTSLLFLGAIVSSQIGGKAAVFGRLIPCRLSGVCFFIGGLLCGLASFFKLMLLGRFIIGMGLGFSAYASAYIAEMSRKDERGFYSSFFQFAISCGSLWAFIISLPCSVDDTLPVTYVLPAFQYYYYRFMYLFVSLLAVASLICTFVFSENTPVFLAGVSRFDEARMILMKVYSRDEVDEYFDEICETMSTESTKKASVFEKKYRHVLAVGIILAGLQSLCGMGVMVAKSNGYFKALGVPIALLTYLSIFMCICTLASCFITSLIIDKAGRRILLIFGLAIQFISLLIPSVLLCTYGPELSWLPYVSVTCIYAFVIGFGVSFGCTMWVYLGEMFPPEIRGVGLGLATMCNWAGGFLYIPFIEILSETVIFCFSTFTCGVSLLFCYLFIKETKGLPPSVSPYIEGYY